MIVNLGYLLITLLLAWVAWRIYWRIQLSMAKHPSLAGHAKMSKFFARLLPYYGFDEEEVFRADGAPAEIATQRRDGFLSLARRLEGKFPGSLELATRLEKDISDLEFTNTYRVPFQFASYVKQHLRLASFVVESRGTQLKDADGNWTYDLAGSYGVNVFGYDFYKSCMSAAAERMADLGPVLGPYHPLIMENVEKLKEISGLDEISFHMSGTEAVMQAVRLARYHTRRATIVTFCGAYHGWWDGVQPGVGNPGRARDVLMLKEMDHQTLKVLSHRNDIACVLINPLQAMHPNRSAPGDSMLISNSRTAAFDREAYTNWLGELRDVCTRRGIVMIMDEVFLGFRLARGGAQAYFNVKADMVTYGKTLGGGFPIGVVCGRSDLMKRFRSDQPADICFARGTFNSHPWVMAAMNEFLQRIESPEIEASYASADTLWNARANRVNETLANEGLPVRVVNMCSIWTILYTVPSRYHWMYQYYLRAEGLSLSWVGSGRLIFSHNYSDADFEEVHSRLVSAAQAMKRDGWWWQGNASPTAMKLRLAGEIARAFLGGSRGANTPEPFDAAGTPVMRNP